MLRHSDQDERESDGWRHRDSIKSVLVGEFAYEGARQRWIFYVNYELFKGTGGLPIEPELMVYFYASKLEKVHIS